MGKLLRNPSHTYSVADSRFKAYFEEGRLTRLATLHGFRLGCAITLALSGTELQDIMGHIGWRHHSTASYYMQLSKVVSANSPSVTLTGQETSRVDPGVLYQSCNILKILFQLFRVN